VEPHKELSSRDKLSTNKMDQTCHSNLKTLELDLMLVYAEETLGYTMLINTLENTLRIWAKFNPMPKYALRIISMFHANQSLQRKTLNFSNSWKKSLAEAEFHLKSNS
jgi:hypothetical protein